MKQPILLICPLFPQTMESLDHHYEVHRYYEATDKQALLSQIAGSVEAVVTDGGAGVSADVLKALPQCRIVTVFGVGVDAVALDYCAANDIRVTNTPHVLSDDVADLGVALMLAVSRNLINADHWARSGNWQSNGPLPLTVRMNGKRAGIVGMGSIGLKLARRLDAFDMQVAYHNRNKRSDTDYRYYRDPVELATESDYLIIAASASAGSEKMISSSVFEALGPEGYLINIARGSIVDESALITALQTGTIKGAGLDVFENEPEIPAALQAMSHVVLQPHVASGTFETRHAMGRVVLENLALFFEGSALSTEYPING